MTEWGIVATLILAGATIPIVYCSRTKQSELLPRPKENLYEKILNKLTRSYSR